MSASSDVAGAGSITCMHYGNKQANKNLTVWRETIFRNNQVPTLASIKEEAARAFCMLHSNYANPLTLFFALWWGGREGGSKDREIQVRHWRRPCQERSKQSLQPLENGNTQLQPCITRQEKSVVLRCTLNSENQIPQPMRKLQLLPPPEVSTPLPKLRKPKTQANDWHQKGPTPLHLRKSNYKSTSKNQTAPWCT